MNPGPLGRRRNASVDVGNRVKNLTQRKIHVHTIPFSTLNAPKQLIVSSMCIGLNVHEIAQLIQLLENEIPNLRPSKHFMVSG